jgi:hypothetical protein
MLWLFSLIVPAQSFAVPGSIAYTGRVTTAVGVPWTAPGGTASMQITLFDAFEGGNPVWGPLVFPAVPVEGGTFSLELGSDGDTTVGEALVGVTQVWLAVSLNGVAMTPRQAVVSVPFAHQAGDAQALGGAPAEDYALRDELDGYVPLTAFNDLALASPAVVGLDGRVEALEVAAPGLVTQSALTAALASVVSQAALAGALSAYVTQAALATTLSGYVTQSSLTATLQNYATTASLSNYVTNGSLATALSGYATTGALSSYVTQASLSSFVPAQAGAATMAQGTLNSSNIVRRTTTSLTLHVRTDGSDAVCNGGFDQPASQAPNCAFATVQRAVDETPEVLYHPVTINVGAGTYRASNPGQVLVRVEKMATGSFGNLVIRTTSGLSDVIFSGASAGAPTVAVGGQGIFAVRTGFTLRNIRFEYFTDVAISLLRGCTARLENVQASNNGYAGLQANEQCYVWITGNTECQFNNNGNVATSLGSGAVIYRGSQLAVEQGSTFTANNNVSRGLECLDGSRCNIAGTFNAIGNDLFGALVSASSVLSLQRDATIGGDNRFGVYTQINSYFEATRPAGTTLSISSTSALSDRVAVGCHVNSYCVMSGGAGPINITGNWDVAFQTSINSSFIGSSTGSKSITGQVHTYRSSYYCCAYGPYNFPSGASGCSSGSSCE